MLSHRMRRATAAGSAIPDSVYKDSGYTAHTTGGNFTVLDLSGKTWDTGDSCWVLFVCDDDFLFMDFNSFNSSPSISGSFTTGGFRLYQRTLQAGDTSFSTGGLGSTDGEGMLAAWLILDGSVGTEYTANATTTPSTEIETPSALSTGFGTYFDVYCWCYAEDLTVFTNDPVGTTLVNQVNNYSIFYAGINLVHQGVLEDTGGGIAPAGQWEWTYNGGGGDGAGNIVIYASVS